MKNKLIVLIAIFAFVGLGYLGYSKMRPMKAYSMEEIAKHSSKEDCWLLIEGKVYDVTPFIPMHKGKDAILKGCGVDATALFNNRPNGSGAHSSLARSIMTKFAIGTLSQ